MYKISYSFASTVYGLFLNPIDVSSAVSKGAPVYTEQLFSNKTQITNSRNNALFRKYRRVCHGKGSQIIAMVTIRQNHRGIEWFRSFKTGKSA